MVTAKCPNCGELSQLPPRYLFSNPACKKCRLTVERDFSSASPQLQQAIERKYQIHLDACLRADIAPAPFDVFAREILELPLLAVIEPPAPRELRTNSSLKQFEHVKIY